MFIIFKLYFSFYKKMYEKNAVAVSVFLHNELLVFKNKLVKIECVQ